MTRHRRDRRSPEEIASAREVVKQVRLKHDKIKAKKDINRGRIAIFVVAAFEAIGVIFYYFAVSENLVELAINATVVGIFITLGVLYTKKPLAIAISALSFYLLLIILNAFADLSTIYNGIILKVVIITILTISIIKAIKFKDVLDELESKSEDDSDILDEELL